MVFVLPRASELLGEGAGFATAYFLATTIAYFAFTFLNKVPSGWEYYHFMIVFFGIASIGAIVRRMLQ